MVSLLDWQLDIHRRVDNGLPNTPVFLEGVGESNEITPDPTGLYKPTVILWFGQAIEMAGFGGRLSVADLCGASKDDSNTTKHATLLVQQVAPSGLALLQLSQAVRDLLVGYAPAGQGELTEVGTGTVRDPYPVGVGDTMRFYLAVGYRGTVNVGRHRPTGVGL